MARSCVSQEVCAERPREQQDALFRKMEAARGWALPDTMKVVDLVRRHGLPWLHRTLIEGQHEFPRGLYFAGRLGLSLGEIGGAEERVEETIEDEHPEVRDLLGGE